MATKYKQWGNSFQIEDDSKFYKLIAAMLIQINKTEVGKKVIGHLEERKVFQHDEIVYIQPTKGKPLFQNRYRMGDVLIFFHPNVLPKLTEPTKETVLKAKMGYVYLFHELVHAYHVKNGEFKSSWGTTAPEEEFRTVGLYEYAHEKISENVLRKGLKLPRRPYYLTKKADDPAVWPYEVARRKLLGLPTPPKHLQQEKTFSPNKFNRPLTKSQTEQAKKDAARSK